MDKPPRPDVQPLAVAPAETPEEDTPPQSAAPTWDLGPLDLRNRDAAHARVALRAGEYVLGGVIAEGGFGVVYRAVHATRRTPAAVKLIHEDLVSRADVVLRFQREVEAIQRIRHPNVVEILDVGRLEDGRPYFAMELLRGRSLEQHLSSRGRLPADEVLAILEPLCSALAAAHALGIVHRDVKPSNVVLCDEGAGQRVVLLDFGIAKLLDATALSLTSSRHVVGTPAFMSPEQILHRPIDPRTDIYALGALLYTMLAGSMPFSANAYPVLRHLHLHQAPPRPSLHAPVDPAFDDIVLRAMSKDPTARYPDVAAFLSDVRAATARIARADAVAAGCVRRPAIGLLVEVLADARALEAPTDAFLTDFEAVLPQAMTELAAAGFSPLAVTGTSALLSADWPRDARAADEARGRALAAALALHARLAPKGARDLGVGLRFCLHAGEVEVSDDGAVVGGNVLELPSCLLEAAEPGVYASPAFLRGLGSASQQISAAEGATIPMRRVIPRPPPLPRGGPAESP